MYWCSGFAFIGGAVPVVGSLPCGCDVCPSKAKKAQISQADIVKFV